MSLRGGCEPDEAISLRDTSVDCFVANAPRNDVTSDEYNITTNHFSLH